MKVIDLFCGAGGFSEGFRQAGFEIAMGIDIDKNACMTFEHNFPDAQVIEGDIIGMNLPLLDLDIDVVIGSPPCKEFSIGHPNRNFDLTLIKAFLKIIEIIKPKYWVMENTPGVKIIYEDLFRKLPLPKNFNYQILNAIHFGVASNRTRFFGGIFPKIILSTKRYYDITPVKNIIRVNNPGFRAYETSRNKDFRIRKIDVDDVGPCITTHRKHIERYLLPSGRQLEVGEMALLMGFPDNFLFLGSRSKAVWLIGNAVCPPVAKAIAETILKTESNKGKYIC